VAGKKTAPDPQSRNSFNSTGPIAMKMATMQLTEFSWRKNGLKVSNFYKGLAFSFNFNFNLKFI
jgi:hypothetical protein